MYTLGGAGALLAGYFTRYTHDIDYMDLKYQAWQGKYLDLLGTQTDILEFSHTTVSPTYKNRAKIVYNGENLKVYVLSKEDIVVSKLCSYAEKDKKDIDILMKTINKQELLEIIKEVKNDINSRVPKIKEQFLQNLEILIKEYSLILE
ncbi:DUF6036 family nucleotidyltransferase [Abyssisolibacter fermentans]|uniref:DUF6036 family nucleotidyltransferase n=1 Tax=Abyssisolibacter fermentans TaxID=1766203 RepID=UPI001FA76436|nr:DUF6036 family nucleotidyltransferase [Abyssisolibacter fermentans]